MQKIFRIPALTAFALLVFLLSGLSLVHAQPPPIDTYDVPTPDEVREDGWTLVPKGCLGEDAHDTNKCGFPQFLELIANIIGALIAIALGLAVLLFAVAGFIYVTAAGSPEKIKNAKKIFFNVAIGLAVLFAAYLIVQVIVYVLGVVDEYNIFLSPYPN